MEKENVQFRKNFIWNVLGTGLNAFNSLFFMIIVTRLNGVDQAGIFTIAFSTACIIYFVGVYAGRIYQVTELNKEITDKEFIVNRSISTILMLILVILFSVIRGYNLYKSTMFLLLTLYKALEAFSDVLYGILQKNDRLEIVGKSFFMKALFSVILFFIIDYITKNMITSTISIILVNIIILIVFDFKNVLKFVDLKTKVKKENILKIFKSGFFTFAISFLGVYILNAPKYAIDSFLAENYQTIFGIIVMPATVIGLVAQFLIHPYLNKIVELYKNRDLKNLNKLILKLIFMIVAFGIISSLLAYFLGPEVLGLVYGIDLKVYRIGLLIIIISATLYTIGVIYSSVLTAVRETFSQFIAYIIISLFAIVCSNILTKQKGMNGAVIAYFAIMALQFIIYTTYTNIKLRKIFNKEEENE
ncbi:MAG: lipopolysaccharide biosynthesis protein [Clostridia bacterium]|jgi:O-antigen/teichoic acid export membrane protein